MNIRAARDGDAEAICSIGNEAITEGTSLYWRHSKPVALVQHLIGSEKALRVAEEDGEVRGFYMLHANAPERGSHIANAMYVVARRWRGQGIGKALARDSLITAARMGFRALQFNAVVSSNQPSIALWSGLGFTEIGRIPEAFQTDRGPSESVIIYYRPITTAEPVGAANSRPSGACG